jgi:N-glycosylase/DNA lyase
MTTIINNKEKLNHLKTIYRLKKKEILARLKEFEQNRLQKSDEEIFGELTFCLLTPQSRAKSCWEAIVTMKEQQLLVTGSVDRIRKSLHCVRFHNKKAEYIVAARKLFLTNGRISIKPLIEKFTNIYECREWLVKNIKGLGYKEAGHFLRNMGLGEKLAILDRHILRNLSQFGVIYEIPTSLGKAKYLQIEKKMIEFSQQIGIPMSHLDLLWWYKETGEIFK